MRRVKDSGVVWLGKIPAAWEVGRVKNGFEVTLGKMLASEQESKDATLENYLCAANIKWDGVKTDVQKKMWFTKKERDEYLLHDGDVVIMEGGLSGTSTPSLSNRKCTL